MAFLAIAALIILIFLSYKETREEKIIFVGDMFFDRHIRQVMYVKGDDFVFSCINDFLKSSDFVVGNLEGPITENASRSLLSQVETPENYTFTFPTNTAKLLYKNNIKIVDLGNNHIGNFGLSGIESTRKFLNEARVGYFGGLSSKLPNGAESEPIFRKGKLSFVSYNEFGGASPETVAEKIKKEKENGQTVIVFSHWGDEYSPAPERIRAKAKIFAEAGAGLIVGSHPHIILPKEIITTKSGQKVLVYYSLGNFIFDQYWDKSVSTGLALEVSINGDKMEITEHKVSLQKDGRTCLTN